MNFRPFNEKDFEAFAGADGWQDKPPLIGEKKLATGQELTVVLARTGVGLIVDDNLDYLGFTLPLNFPTQKAAAVFGSGLSELNTLDDFIEVGFRIP